MTLDVMRPEPSAIWTPEPKRVAWRSLVALEPGMAAGVDAVGRAFAIVFRPVGESDLETRMYSLPDPPPED